MSNSQIFSRAKTILIRFATTVRKIASSKGKLVSRAAWDYINELSVVKLADKMFSDKEYRCTKAERGLVLEFYNRIAGMYKTRKIQDWTKDEYLEHYCDFFVLKAIEEHPVTVIDSSGKEVEVMSGYLGTISISDKLSVVEALDFNNPLSIDWLSLEEKEIISFNDQGFPCILNDSYFVDKDCLLTHEEYCKAVRLDLQLMVAYTSCEYAEIWNQRKALSDEILSLGVKYRLASDSEEATKLLRKIKTLRKKYDSFVKASC